MTCARRCVVVARLLASRGLARRLGLRTRTIGERALSVEPGVTTVWVPIKRSVLRRMRQLDVLTARLSLAVEIRERGRSARRVTTMKRVAVSRH